MLSPVAAQAPDRPVPPVKGARAPAPAEDRSRLPVKRVALYKNGVGYFEHVGQVRGNQDLTIAFTSGQLNDVLKSLTVLDLNGGRIAGVEYGSTAPLDRELGTLRLPVGEKPPLTSFLGALQGARLEVRSGTNVITGRLLSIERKTRISGGTALEVDYLSIVSDNGELRTVELSPASSVRLLDRELASRVERYLDLMGLGRQADERRVTISAHGSAERSLFVSYISEVPVWKTTYRLVLSGNESPLLQGWAIVDNTVGQDWNNVQLSLVAGAPQSFVQNLSQPFYARRPVISPPEAVNLSPQTYQATLLPGAARLAGVVTDATGAAIPGAVVKAVDANGAVLAETTTRANGAYELNVMPEVVSRIEAESPGFKRTVITNVAAAGSNTQNIRMDVGNVSQAVEVTAAAPSLQTEAAEMRADRAAGARLGSGRGLGTGRGIGGTRPAMSPGSGSASVAAVTASPMPALPRALSHRSWAICLSTN